MTLDQSPEDLRSRLAAILDTLADDLIADTKRIIAFETVSGGNREQEAKYREQIPACMAWLAGLAQEHGFAFQHWDHRVAEIEWKAEGEKGSLPLQSIGIASHIDVVTPVGPWKFGPFNAEIEGGILYGRGVQDDKGPLIQSLYGMIAIKKAGIKLPFDVRIIIGTQEETGDWSDIGFYLEKRGAPDCSFTPDADFPIIIGEKGMYNARFRASWPKAAPHEETGMEFLRMKGGDRSNIVPSLAEVTLRFPSQAKHAVMKEMVRETTRFTVENRDANVTLIPSDNPEAEAAGSYEALLSFLGKGAHSSTPDKGHNAALDALRFFADLETLPDTVRAFIQFLAYIGAEHDGRHLRIESTHEFVGATTAVLSLLEIGPEGGEANINIRPTMGMACADVKKRCQEAAEAFHKATGLQIEATDDGREVDAIYLDPGKPEVSHFLGALQGAFEAVTGQDGSPTAVGGTTYSKGFPNCCAFGPILEGVDEELAHQANERLAVASIKRNALIYGLSLALMAKAPAGN